jgi:hypothetical protein
MHFLHFVLLFGGASIGALVGGLTTWRRETEAMENSIDVASAPAGVRGRDYRRSIKRQRRRKRVVATVLTSLFGAVLGIALVIGFALLQHVT